MQHVFTVVQNDASEFDAVRLLMQEDGLNYPI